MNKDLKNDKYRIPEPLLELLKNNLSSLGKEYEIDHDYEKLHDALVDLQLNIKVWNKIKWQVDL